MFQVREHRSNQHQSDSIEITTNGDKVPLNENWKNRWCIFPQHFGDYYAKVYNFKVRGDDVLVITTPKSGTTLMQEAVWLLLNKLNYDVARREYLGERSPFLEHKGLNPRLPKDRIAIANSLKSPRLLKSHLPIHLLPHEIWERKTKLIYCTRSLKDIIVSYYHHQKGLGDWTGNNIDEFVDDFVMHDIAYTPHWPGVIDFWRMRDQPNIFFTTYEQMLNNQSVVLRELCKFLERPALTVEEMETLLTHLSFKNMKANNKTNPTEQLTIFKNVASTFNFMRRGVVGAHKDELSLENQQRIDEYSRACLKDLQLTNEEIQEIMSVLG